MELDLSKKVSQYDSKYMFPLKVTSKAVKPIAQNYLLFVKKFPKTIFSQETIDLFKNNSIQSSVIDAANQHIKHFGDFLLVFSNRMSSLGYTFGDLPKLLDNERTSDFQDLMDKFQEKENKTVFAKKALIKMTNKYKDVSCNINEKIVITFQCVTPDAATDTKKAKKDIEELLNNVMKLRKENKPVMHSLQMTYDGNLVEVHKMFDKLHGMLSDRCMSIKQLVRLLCESLNDVMSNMLSYVDTMTPVLEKIESVQEFKTMMENKKVHRYDMSFREFKPIDMNHECFQGLEKVGITPMCHYFPKFVGKALYSFDGKESDEISIKKNQMVLILEDPSNEWILALDIESRIAGYVPESYVKILGTGVGICYSDENRCDWEYPLCEGDFIALKQKRIVDKKFVGITLEGAECDLSFNTVELIGGTIEIVD